MAALMNLTGSHGCRSQQSCMAGAVSPCSSLPRIQSAEQSAAGWHKWAGMGDVLVAQRRLTRSEHGGGRHDTRRAAHSAQDAPLLQLLVGVP